uniref:Tyrosine-protein phosphatase domain-containing protein n=1 Tax=Panagrolaimus sp. PS1159 TaxID=55785 RepID=A0AC35GBW6_9BILA
MKKKAGNKKAAKKQQRASIQQDIEDGGASRMQPTTAGAPANGGNVAVATCAKNAREEVKKWAARTLDKGIQGLREEFNELKRYCPPDMSIATFQTHWEAGRNRYKDVPCQDKCRIILKWPGQQHDYIHANYVATPISEKRFICTQGPLDCTITDFWHMVIQEETETLIMLC